MAFPPVRGLSYVQVDKHGITILYHLHQCRLCTSRDMIFRAKVDKGGVVEHSLSTLVQPRCMRCMSWFLQRPC